MENIVKSDEENAGQNDSIKISNKSFEKIEQFRYFGRTPTNQHSTHGENKSRLKLGNVCCLSVQNLLSSRFISKNIKIKIYRIVILSVVEHGCEIWSLTLREGE